MKANDDPRASSTVVIGVIGALVLFLIVVALQAVYYRAERAESLDKVYRAVPEELTRVRNEQMGRLHTPRWVDRAQGVVAIPVEDAMDLVVEEAARARAAERGGKP